MLQRVAVTDSLPARGFADETSTECDEAATRNIDVVAETSV